MKISITAVTRNRMFSKALIRISPQIEPMKLAMEGFSTTDEEFDVLQIVFVDKNDEYLKVSGTKKGDRLFQVEVGIPSNISFKPDSDEKLAKETKRRVLTATNVSSLQQDRKIEASKLIEAAGNKRT